MAIGYREVTYNETVALAIHPAYLTAALHLLASAQIGVSIAYGDNEVFVIPFGGTTLDDLKNIIG